MYPLVKRAWLLAAVLAVVVGVRPAMAQTEAPGAAAPEVALDAEPAAATAVATTEPAGAPPAVANAPTEPPVPELDEVESTPTAAPAPVDTNEFDEVEPMLEGVPPLHLVLDDGLGDEVPWNDYDPYTEHGPEGLVHVGAKLRVNALFSTEEQRVRPGPGLELSAFVDLRFSRRSRWHFRAALGISWQLHTDEFLGAGRWHTSSPGAVRLRLQPFAMDIGHFVSLRLGPSIGVQLVPRPNQDDLALEAFGGGTAELALRLLDGLLEVAVHGGMQLTGVGTVQRPNDFEPAWRSGVFAQPLLGASVAGVLP